VPHRTHAIHCAANHLHPPPHPITQAHPQYAYMQLRKYFINGVANLLAIVTSSNCTQLTENHKARMEALYAEMVEVLKDPHAEGFVHMPKNFKKVRGRHPLTPPPAAHPTERVLLLTPQRECCCSPHRVLLLTLQRECCCSPHRVLLPCGGLGGIPEHGRTVPSASAQPAGRVLNARG
jgi:hypothetical protein